MSTNQIEAVGRRFAEATGTTFIRADNKSQVFFIERNGQEERVTLKRAEITLSEQTQPIENTPKEEENMDENSQVNDQAESQIPQEAGAEDQTAGKKAKKAKTPKEKKVRVKKEKPPKEPKGPTTTDKIIDVMKELGNFTYNEVQSTVKERFGLDINKAWIRRICHTKPGIAPTGETRGQFHEAVFGYSAN